MRSRDYDEEQWNHYRERLTRRGLLDRDGELTDVGRDLKQRIEDATDRLALAASMRWTTMRWRDCPGPGR